VLSLRAHRLVAQPFIVVGLIAVVRRILFVLTPGSTTVSTPELALLIAMVAVFIAGLVWSAASRRAMTERNTRSQSAPQFAGNTLRPATPVGGCDQEIHHLDFAALPFWAEIWVENRRCLQSMEAGGA
jgi:hypothetical protein